MWKPSLEPTTNTSGSTSPSLLHGRAFYIHTSLSSSPSFAKSFTNSYATPKPGVKAGFCIALSHHKNQSRYHDIWGLLHELRRKLLSSRLSFPSLYFEHKLLLRSQHCCAVDLAKAWLWHKSLLEEPKSIWIPAREGFGTDGQRTNRFHATWSHWKETIAGGKENNQAQRHVLSLPISALA